MFTATTQLNSSGHNPAANRLAVTTAQPHMTATDPTMPRRQNQPSHTRPRTPPSTHQQHQYIDATALYREQRKLDSRMLALFGLILILTMDYTNLLAQPLIDNLQRCALVLTIVGLYAWVQTSNLKIYKQYRDGLVFVCVTAMAIFPISRTPQFAMRRLNRQPILKIESLKDRFRYLAEGINFTAGCRFNAGFAVALLTPLPLALHLVRQVILVVAITSNGAACNTILLKSDVYQRSFAFLASAFHTLPASCKFAHCYFFATCDCFVPAYF